MPRGIYTRTQKTRNILSAAFKGRIPWNKGKRTGQVPKAAFKKGHVTLGIKERNKKNPPNYRHGLRGHYLYKTHCAMMSRCYNSKVREYKDYGGAAPAVTVWEPWHERAVFFRGIQTLIGSRPEGMTLDRINPWDGYYPWNVRWADRKTQNNNHRRNVPEYYWPCGEH
jgi:hypothetical protein